MAGERANDGIGCMTIVRASSLDRLGMRKLSMREIYRGISRKTNLILSLSKDEAGAMAAGGIVREKAA